ncbi:sulfotransferase family protein [Lewinella cohaerens]|uniref:sulfotransferase family protein n=1 Tax=Lewinella cohaerens TaxID=70995 RepID=UPI000373AD6B|nr:sulfotransferase [Lewinella cohaerens]
MKTPPQQTFFIAGVPRSGTTLLQLLLDHHSEIAVCPETNIFNVIDRVLANKEIKKDWQYEQLIAVLNQRLKDFDDPAFSVMNAFQAAHSSYSGSTTELLNALRESYLSAKGKKIFGEKTPENIYFLSTIHKVCPQAKIILIVRHPLDVTCSLLKSFQKSSVSRSYSASRLLQKAAIFVKRGLLAIKQLERLFPGKAYIVYYEQLVKNPQKELQQLCQFLQVNYESGMLDFYNRDLIRENTPVLENIHQHLSNPISSNRTQKYLTELRPFERQWVKTFLGKSISNTHYELPSETAKWPMRYHIQLVLARLNFSLKTYYWREVLKKSWNYLRLKANR